MDDMTAAAREWLLELDGSSVFHEFDTWEDYVQFVAQLPADEVRQAVQRHYSGGWKQFVLDTSFPL